MSDYSELNCNSKQKIVNDLKNVVADAEEILRATADIAGEKVSELRSVHKWRTSSSGALARSVTVGKRAIKRSK